jgi:peptide/nickel transport system permease protein
MRERFRFLRTTSGAIGAGIVLFVVLVAVFGPYLAPHDPAAPVGIPLSGSSSHAWLGTDFLGRDVLSRVLYGGRSVIGYAAAATVLAYLVGMAIGLTAGYARSLVDPVLMRSVDVMLAFPPLLFLLVLIAGAGTSIAVLIIGVAAIQARGERAFAVIGREVLPNIMAPLLVDAGLRFTYSILIIASVNFLGLGLQPPNSDWALMISENRTYIQLNPWSVLVPAAMIGLLTIGINLTGDAIARSLGRSYVPRTTRSVVS